MSYEIKPFQCYEDLIDSPLEYARKCFDEYKLMVKEGSLDYPQDDQDVAQWIETLSNQDNYGH